MSELRSQAADSTVGARPAPRTSRVPRGAAMPSGAAGMDGELREQMVAVQQALAHGDLWRARVLLRELDEILTGRGTGDLVLVGYLTVILTPAERRVLWALVTGKPQREIADMLHLSVSTVKSHLRSIYRKLGVHSRRDAVSAASEVAT